MVDTNLHLLKNAHVTRKSCIVSTTIIVTRNHIFTFPTVCMCWEGGRVFFTRHLSFLLKRLLVPMCSPVLPACDLWTGCALNWLRRRPCASRRQCTCAPEIWDRPLHRSLDRCNLEGSGFQENNFLTLSTFSYKEQHFKNIHN